MTRSHATRELLLDSAERLFAEHGPGAVSDRRIAEAAAQGNHSAVRYYFGGRDGLLQALVERHLVRLEESRAARFEGSDSLLDDVRALVLPFTDELADQPVPSWRARFTARLLSDPTTAELIRDAEAHAPVGRRIIESIHARLDHLDPGIALGRTRLMTRIAATTCADVEELAAREGTDPRWRAVGDFLADALTGMLQAPSSQSSHYPTPAQG